MRFKILSLLAALVFVSACASEPEETSEATNTGASGGSSTGTAATTGTATTPTAETVTPGSVKDFVVNVGDRIFFDFDSSDIRADAVGTLEAQAAFLRTFPSLTVVVEGHADERGTREYNLALGERRANAHKDYLISIGVDPARIETISYGKERPAVAGSNEAAWAQNRRAVVVLKNAPSS